MSQVFTVYHEDLIFCKALTTNDEEMDMDLTKTLLDNSYGNQADDVEEFSWDQLILD